MPNEQKPEPTDTRSAMDLIPAFQRCRNYPRDEAGILAFARGLERAATATGVAMEAIVQSCLQNSEYCPTDYELMAAARGAKKIPTLDEFQALCAAGDAKREAAKMEAAKKKALEAIERGDENVS